MQIFYKIEDFPNDSKPIILTIGNFDGLHKGHAFVLKTMTEAADTTYRTCAITFDNHPSEVLRPEHKIPLLCTYEHKIKLLDQFKVNTAIVLHFTLELASYSAESFISHVREFIPFTHLILGHDATLGKNRLGKPDTMLALAKKLHFEIQYLKEYRHEEKIISSSFLRLLLNEGKLDEVEALLGRPYSIYSKVIPGIGKGKEIGFPTANIAIKRLCLPPYGVYSISLKSKDSSLYSGLANLGIAPTVKNSNEPHLEVHLFNQNLDLYGEYVEVFFHQYIRPEKKFASLEDLKKQIRMDIDTTLVKKD